MKNTINAPIVILAGGLGTRLRSTIGQSPKVLAKIREHTFLDFLLRWLEKQGAQNIILSLGYKADMVVDELSKINHQLNINYVIESEPLGTLGGLSYTLRSENIGECIVLNGDTFVDTNLIAFITQQRENKSYMALMAKYVDNIERYGQLSLNSKSNTVAQFIEKSPDNLGHGWINSGIYYFSKSASVDIQSYAKGSLENDFFAKRFNTLSYQKIKEGCFIDIGTPDSFLQAQSLLKDYY